MDNKESSLTISETQPSRNALGYLESPVHQLVKNEQPSIDLGPL